MMYYIKPFNESDLKTIAVSDSTRKLIEFIGIETMTKGFNAGATFTAFYNDKPFAIGGVSMVWPKVGEAWIIFDVEYVKHGFFIHRNALKYIKHLMKTLDLERLQAAVLKDHWAAIEWINRLGFEFEGEMVKYFQGKTYLRYAKIL